jgi:hypothetical protein
MAPSRKAGWCVERLNGKKPSVPFADVMPGHHHWVDDTGWDV